MNPSAAVPPVVSPYLHFGTTTFRNRAGEEVVPVYQADRARVLLIPVRLARLLKANFTDALTPPVKQSAIDAGLIGDSVAEFRAAHHRRILANPTGPRTRRFVLMPSGYCNMGCEYCGQSHTKGVVRGDHRDAIVDRVIAAARSDDTADIHVAWFGGEPLLAFAILRDLGKRIIRACDSLGKPYSAKLTTNGALLDSRKLAILAQEQRLGRVDITLDGPAAIHDSHRPMKNGMPTFYRLTRFLADAIRKEEFKDVTFILRTNVDDKNKNSIDEYLAYMAENGFAHAHNVLFQLSPIHAWGNDIGEISVQGGEVEQLELQWIERMIDLRLRCAFLPSQVVTNTCVATDLASEVIDPAGGIFSCTEHPLVPNIGSSGRPLVHIGSISPAKLRPPGEYDTWRHKVTSAGQQCSTCNILPVCGGHCPKQWSDGVVPCPTVKNTVPQRLDLLLRSKGYDIARESWGIDGGSHS